MKKVVLMFDGGIRNGQMSYGYWAVKPDLQGEIKHITKSSEWIPMTEFAHGGKCGKNGTSNVAEYRALLYGLKKCIEEEIRVVHIFGDSQLIVKQITGAFQVKNDDLKKEHTRVMKLLGCFNTWTIKWVPREQNKKADYLAALVFKRGKKK